MKHRIFLLIPLVSILSLWQLIFFFFSWEEFAFFYAYQNPEIADTIFKTPGYSNHPILPYLSPLFYVFGYNPVPYNVLGLLVFGFLSTSVYFLSKLVFLVDKKTAIYAALIFAAGYFGVGTFTTNTYSTFTGGLGVSFVVINLIILKLLLKKFSIKKLFLFLLTYLLCIKIFTSRSFSLPAVYSALVLFSTGSLRKAFIIGIFSVIPIALSFSPQTTKLTSAIPHISFKITDFFESLLGNVGHSFFPSLFIKNKLVSIGIGLVFTIVSLVRKETRLPILLLLTTLGAQLLAIIVNYQYFSVWQSPNHYFTSLAIFSAPIVAIFLKKRLWLMITIIIGLVILSNYQIYTELQNHSNNLRYFYETVQKHVPNNKGKKVVLVYTKEPRPLDPFITLPFFSGEIYLPGFYGKKASEMKVTQSFQDSVDFLRQNKLSEDDFYVFTYALYNLKDVSAEARKILADKKVLNNIPEFENFKISGLVPLSVSFNYEPAEGILNNLQSEGNLKLKNFLDWHKKIEVTTIPEKSFGDRKKEYLLDSDFETTWIPSQWENPVVLIFTLPEKKAVSKLVWSVSRTSSWPARTPTDYKIFTSEDGQDWKSVADIRNGNKILTNEFRIEEINSNSPVSFIKFEIYKTLEGALPAIDDIQIIPSDLDNLSYQSIQGFIENTKNKVCLQWKTNDDNEFRFQRQACSENPGSDGKYIFEIEPRIEEILGFRAVDKDGKTLDISNFNISHPIF